MSKSTISFFVFVLFVLLVFGGIKLASNNVKDNIPLSATTTKATTTIVVPKETTTNKGGITMTDVKKHNNVSDCWSVVNNGVYNLTSFVSSHPGGREAIIGLCGIDGTAAFVDQHGNQRRPNNELAGLKIGDLSK